VGSCDCSWTVVSERVRVCLRVMGVGVDAALTSRLSDVKSALCRSSAVMRESSGQEPNPKISSKLSMKKTRLASMVWLNSSVILRR
jgi:hypothetical protein